MVLPIVAQRGGDGGKVGRTAMAGNAGTRFRGGGRRWEVVSRDATGSVALWVHIDSFVDDVDGGPYPCPL